jgi:hypothetical protein
MRFRLRLDLSVAELDLPIGFPSSAETQQDDDGQCRQRDGIAAAKIHE